MLKPLLFVSLGAVVGAVARYLLSEATLRAFGDGFPYGTLLVNVIGCLVIGILGGAIPDMLDPTKLLLITGMLGALTTFSAFGWESLELMQNGKVGVALVNIGLNVIVSLVAVYGGYLIGQHFAPEVIS
jgi:CrcB protein|tara:strand:+ start:10635 stop:11021 length:387 start_codon:yes stop_codon:yes gene_type:complete